MTRELLFSITKKDLNIQTFRSGGPGGQNQNKVESGIRICHPASGAVAECRETRDQHENKKRALIKLVATSKFKAWHKLECAKYLKDYVSIEERVKREMNPKNLRLEIKNEKDRWTIVTDIKETIDIQKEL